MSLKFPKIPHLPWSPGRGQGDVGLENIKHFRDMYVVVTVKMDGENTSMYRNLIHARSLEPLKRHDSRTWVLNMWGSMRYEIPEGWRICGENLYAKHSIWYKNLFSYFQVFGIWDGETCLSWADTVLYSELLNLRTVPVLYEGIFDYNILTRLHSSHYNGDECEGYVVRNINSFLYADFAFNVAKYVRANHVQTDEHWLERPVIPNLLRRNAQ